MASLCRLGSWAAERALSAPIGSRRVPACALMALVIKAIAPPLQFDPLLAKVIGSSNSSASFESALDRTLRALDEFHIEGLPTNLGELRALLQHPEVRAGDARTSLFAEQPELTSSNSAKPSGTIVLLRQNRPIPRPLGSSTSSRMLSGPPLELVSGDRRSSNLP